MLTGFNKPVKPSAKTTKFTQVQTMTTALANSFLIVKCIPNSEMLKCGREEEVYQNWSNIVYNEHFVV